MNTDPKYHLLVNVSGTTVPFINTEMRLVGFQTLPIFYSTWSCQFVSYYLGIFSPTAHRKHVLDGIGPRRGSWWCPPAYGSQWPPLSSVYICPVQCLLLYSGPSLLHDCAQLRGQ